MRTVDQILDEALALAEIQLDAARRLDAAQLAEATERRADLVFEMRLIKAAGPSAPPSDSRVDALRAMDERLAAVLRSATETLGAATAPERSATYGKRGLLKERA